MCDVVSVCKMSGLECVCDNVKFRPYACIDRRMWKYSFYQGKVLVFEGNIGAGKSSLAIATTNFFNKIGISAVYLPEYVDIELLNMFIQDMKTYAYSFQLFMLEKRAEIYRKAIELAKLGHVVIMDRMLHGDYVFALHHHQKGNISEKQFTSYLERMEKLKLSEPALIFYLETTPECSHQRALKRNRKGETYPLSYFQEIDSNYQEVFKDYTGNIVPIPYNDDLNTTQLLEKAEDVLNSGLQYLLS